MKRRNRLILILLTVIIIAAGLIIWQLFGPTINSPEGNFFYIRTGSTYQDVKNSLIKKRIVNSITMFDRVAGYLKYDQMVKAGKYKITDGMSVVNLVRMLRSGTQSPVNLVITKLRTKEDFASLVGKKFECDSAAFIHFLNNIIKVIMIKEIY